MNIASHTYSAFESVRRHPRFLQKHRGNLFQVPERLRGYRRPDSSPLGRRCERAPKDGGELSFLVAAADHEHSRKALIQRKYDAGAAMGQKANKQHISALSKLQGAREGTSPPALITLIPTQQIMARCRV